MIKFIKMQKIDYLFVNLLKYFKHNLNKYHSIIFPNYNRNEGSPSSEWVRKAALTINIILIKIASFLFLNANCLDKVLP